MAEHIEREALMRNLKQFAPEQLTPLVESLIQKQPAADVVGVVRCEDCKNYDNQFSIDNCGWCDEFNCGTSDERFCSYGKRKGGDESDSKKVKYRFEFEVSDSWKAGETACWTECPFSPLIGLGRTCKFLTTKELKCPFRDNRFKTLIR